MTHSWQQSKKDCEIMIEDINSIIKSKIAVIWWATESIREEQYDKRFLSIRQSGVSPRWKTIFSGQGNNISEGYATWKELEVFLRGLRRGVTLV